MKKCRLFLVLLFILFHGGTLLAQQTNKSGARGNFGVPEPKPARTPHEARVPKTSGGSSKSSKSSSSTKTSRATSYPSTAFNPTADAASKAALDAMELERVKRLQQERLEADLKKDRTWFEANFADDLTSVNSDGVSENKEQALSRSLDPANTIQSEVYDELSVRPYGDTMLATGTFTRTGKNERGAYTAKSRFTSVWVNRNGTWQEVAIHESPFTPGPVPTSASPSPSLEPKGMEKVKPSPSSSPSQ